ncbi:calmodulin-like protein 1 [Iris pallida]|uniref:Calmodulin-like protein 1 n=1 Tax=Iris pallida TaxID=29817 RepID=A0AAX6HFJ3_IRIPA|nr:calmodulin-like protein 1 [Iris pallida]KAJ6839642.1 calmodulin-like protein 1 [Iris pallida]KAJ6839643.1 calmodulin-like protein 1 [Iris pallida]
MSKLKILNFQYNLTKKLSRKPLKSGSAKDRELSDLTPTFQPDTDEMKMVFRKIDRNKDGKISSDELRALLESLGKKDVAAEAAAMVRAADLNRDGYIDFQEFMDVHKKGVTTADIRNAFWAFDQNGDGRISAEEVMAMLWKLGEGCSLEDCRRMVRQVDKNGDGLVDMDEFMAMMTCTMKQA